MAIGRTFKESFQKALRGLEVGAFGFGSDSKDVWGPTASQDDQEIRSKLTRPNAQSGVGIFATHEVGHKL